LTLREKQEFVIKVLSESRLTQMGLVKGGEIIRDIKKGNLKKYFEKDTISFLMALVRLEYYLKTNNIRL